MCMQANGHKKTCNNSWTKARTKALILSNTHRYVPLADAQRVYICAQLKGQEINHLMSGPERLTFTTKENKVSCKKGKTANGIDSLYAWKEKHLAHLRDTLYAHFSDYGYKYYCGDISQLK